MPGGEQRSRSEDRCETKAFEPARFLLLAWHAVHRTGPMECSDQIPAPTEGPPYLVDGKWLSRAVQRVSGRPGRDSKDACLDGSIDSTGPFAYDSSPQVVHHSPHGKTCFRTLLASAT
jgi:hypothetical protein